VRAEKVDGKSELANDRKLLKTTKRYFYQSAVLSRPVCSFQSAVTSTQSTVFNQQFPNHL